MSNLIQIVDAALASAAIRSGPHLACRPGCTQCCHGVFAISHQDAGRLRTGLDLLTQTDPVRAQSVRDRVADSIARLAPSFPGNSTSGILTEDDEATGAFEDFANDEPCPVLDPASGTCDLYLHRPILCRTFGPPARMADGDLAHCELCYAEANTEEISACELDPSLAESVAANDEAFNTTHTLTGRNHNRLCTPRRVERSRKVLAPSVSTCHFADKPGSLRENNPPAGRPSQVGYFF